MRIKNCPSFKHILLSASLLTVTACSSAQPALYAQPTYTGDAMLNTALLQSRLHDMRRTGIYHPPQQQKPVMITEPMSPFLAGAEEEAKKRFNPKINTAPQNSYVRRSSIPSHTVSGHGLNYYSIPASSP